MKVWVLEKEDGNQLSDCHLSQMSKKGRESEGGKLTWPLESWY